MGGRLSKEPLTLESRAACMLNMWGVETTRKDFGCPPGIRTPIPCSRGRCPTVERGGTRFIIQRVMEAVKCCGSDGSQTIELRSTGSRGRLSPHNHLPKSTRDHLSVAVSGQVADLVQVAHVDRDRDV